MSDIPSDTLYKVLGRNRQPFHGGIGQWPYRKWTPNLDPIPCMQGYHVCRLDHLLTWFGPEIWMVEVRGKLVDHGDKLVAESARLIRRTPWSPRTALLFAADCAEHVLPIFERTSPNDVRPVRPVRPRQAIEVTRRLAEGRTTKTNHVAWSAAWDVVKNTTWNLAWCVVNDATCDVAWAVGDTARAAERQWQAERLGQYLRGEA